MSKYSDYKNLLDVFAGLQIQSFSELQVSDQMELLAAFMSDENHEGEVFDMFLDFLRSGSLSELMYRSKTPTKVGNELNNIIMSGPHIRTINEDMDKAFCDYMMSLDNYKSDENDLRREDNANRRVGLSKVYHQRMGI